MNGDAMKFSDMLKEMAETQGDKTALVYRDIRYTYRELHKAVELCAGDLVKKGVKPGEHVALWSFNSANWLIAFFGIIRAGGVAVLANYGMPYEYLGKLLAFTDVKLIVYGLTREIQKDEKAACSLAETIGADPAGVYDIRAEKMDYLGRINAGERPDALPDENPDSRRTAVIIFTSGTSGTIKAVQQSQFALLSNSRWTSVRIRELMGEKLMLALPLFHSFGLEGALCYLGIGSAVYLTDELAPDTIVNTILTHQITDIFSVGVLYSGIVAHPRFADETAGLIRFCAVGGGFTTPVQMMRLSMLFSSAAFRCGYGQTEACTIITSPLPGDSIETCAHTVGKPLDGLDVRIYDPAQGFLPAGKTGEVVVRGDSLMNGYYKLPPERQTIDADGWLHTEDLGYFDEAGYLHLAGRIKDIIIKNGENISPAELEAAIAECAGIREVKVLGAPHPLFGESIEACVVMQPGVEFDDAALREELKTRLSSFKTPSHFHVFERLPMTANGKLDARALQSAMFDRLKTAAIAESLTEGVCVAKIVIKNTSYTVVPTAAMVENLMRAVGFSADRTRRIRLAAEEMLLERISNGSADVGDITVKIILYKDWVTLQFSDNGERYCIEKNTASSYSAMIILKTVDSYKTECAKDGRPMYCLSFLYEKDFDVGGFLKVHTRDVANMLKT